MCSKTEKEGLKKVGHDSRIPQEKSETSAQNLEKRTSLSFKYYKRLEGA